jgi:hypothetical protein
VGDSSGLAASHNSSLTNCVVISDVSIPYQAFAVPPQRVPDGSLQQRDVAAEGSCEVEVVYHKRLLELVESLHNIAYGIEADGEYPLRINLQKTFIIVTSTRNPLT